MTKTAEDLLIEGAQKALDVYFDDYLKKASDEDLFSILKLNDFKDWSGVDLVRFLNYMEERYRDDINKVPPHIADTLKELLRRYRK